MGKPAPTRQRIATWSGCAAWLRRRGAPLIWLDKDRPWLAPPDGRPGHAAVFSDGAIRFCLTVRVLFRLPLRQTGAKAASLLKLADRDPAVPDGTTLCRRQTRLAVRIPCQRDPFPAGFQLQRRHSWTCPRRP